MAIPTDLPKMFLDPVKLRISIKHHMGCWVLNQGLGHVGQALCYWDRAPGSEQKVLISRDGGGVDGVR